MLFYLLLCSPVRNLGPNTCLGCTTSRCFYRSMIIDGIAIRVERSKPPHNLFTGKVQDRYKYADSQDAREGTQDCQDVTILTKDGNAQGFQCHPYMYINGVKRGALGIALHFDLALHQQEGKGSQSQGRGSAPF